MEIHNACDFVEGHIHEGEGRMPGRRAHGLIQGRLAQGVGMALRSGAAPLVLGLRWAERRASRRPRGVPAPRRDLALASKIALDEFFFTTELVSATFVSGPDRRRVAAEIDEALRWVDVVTRQRRVPDVLPGQLQT